MLAQAQRVIHRLFPQYRQLLGRIDNASARLDMIDLALETLVKSPRYDARRATPLNGQEVRRQIVERIFESLHFEYAIETGTYTGETTGYLASHEIPVLSSEISSPLFYVASTRLAHLANVSLRLQDSRAFIASLHAEGLSSRACFFYLDAHGHASGLPLEEELELITKHWSDYVVLIDDFAVPFDDDYGYDRYGPKALEIGLLRDIVERERLAIYFPSVPAAKETGAKRGCTVIAKGPKKEEALGRLDLLVRHSELGE